MTPFLMFLILAVSTGSVAEVTRLILGCYRWLPVRIRYSRDWSRPAASARRPRPQAHVGRRGDRDLGHDYRRHLWQSRHGSHGRPLGKAVVYLHLGHLVSLYLPGTERRAQISFTVGAVVIASSYSLGQLVAGRLIMGFGVGGASVIAPLYITELAPTASRGRCIAINAFFIPFGQTVAAALGAAFHSTPKGWRILCEPEAHADTFRRSRTVALGVVPSIIQLALFEFLPESPRVLILRGESEKARGVLRKVYRDAPEKMIDFKLRVAEEYVAATTQLQRTTTLAYRTKQLYRNKVYFRSIVAVSGLQAFGQLCGYNTLLYYAGNLFGLLGISIPALGALIPAGGE